MVICNQHTTIWGDLQPSKKYFFVLFTGPNIAAGRLKNGRVSGLILGRISSFFNAFLPATRGWPGAGRRVAEVDIPGN